MKKISFRLLSCLLTVFTLLPVFSAAAQSASANGDEVMIDVYQEHEIFYEDHVGENLASLTAGNDTVHTSNGKTPINNLYDLKIVGSGYTPFTTFETSSKNLKLLGNHASENTSKNVFTLDNIDDRTAGKGMVTVIPESYMKDLEDKVRTRLGRRVKIHETNRKKSVELTFENDEDLETLLRTLVGQDIFE